MIFITKDYLLYHLDCDLLKYFVIASVQEFYFL